MPESVHLSRGLSACRLVCPLTVSLIMIHYNIIFYIGKLVNPMMNRSHHRKIRVYAPNAPRRPMLSLWNHALDFCLIRATLGPLVLHIKHIEILIK